MPQSSISIRMDSADKKAFEQFCSSVGMNVSTAVNMFVKATLRESRLPFEVKTDPFYSPQNMERLRASIDQMERTGGTIHEVSYD